MCENYELVKGNKNSLLIKEYFSIVIRNLDTKKCNIGSAPALYNINNLTFRATLKYRKHAIIISINDRYKGKDPFNFSNADETDIINKILRLKKELQKNVFSVKSK